MYKYKTSSCQSDVNHIFTNIKTICRIKCTGTAAQHRGHSKKIKSTLKQNKNFLLLSTDSLIYLEWLELLLIQFKHGEKGRGRNSKMARQQDEVKGFTETAMVLSNVWKTVQRREWIQVSHHVRGKTQIIFNTQFWQLKFGHWSPLAEKSQNLLLLIKIRRLKSEP